jgi:hypothetical protein
MGGGLGVTLLLQGAGGAAALYLFVIKLLDESINVLL